jgi:hypothetical protein
LTFIGKRLKSLLWAKASKKLSTLNFVLIWAGERFEGTAFWFPLRQKASDLSDTVYDQKRVRQLMQSLKNEVSTVLLFLKKLENIEVYDQDEGTG